MEGAIIEQIQLFQDRLIEFGKAEESAVSQRSQDPLFDLEDPGFDLGLVFGSSDPCRDDDSTVVLGELPIGGIEVRLIAAGAGDSGPEIIRDGDFWDPSEEAKRMDMGLNPGGKILGDSGLRKSIIACSQGCHKDLYFGDDTGGGIHDRHRLPGIVDKELFTRPILLTQRRIEPFSPLAIESAELAILVTVRMVLLILVPKELKGDALLFQFLVKILHGRHVTFFLSNTRQRREQKALQ